MCKGIRKRMHNDENEPEVILSGRDKLRISTFYVIVAMLETEMRC